MDAYLQDWVTFADVRPCPTVILYDEGYQWPSRSTVKKGVTKSLYLASIMVYAGGCPRCD
jgi:hypothetical protein